MWALSGMVEEEEFDAPFALLLWWCGCGSAERVGEGKPLPLLLIGATVEEDEGSR